MPLSGNSDPGVQGHCAESFRFCSDQNALMLSKAVESLRSCFDRIASNPNHTDAQYWVNQGANGVGQLQVFGAWKAGLLAVYSAMGDTPPAWLSSAGSTLVPHQDGTVTVGQ